MLMSFQDDLFTLSDTVSRGMQHHLEVSPHQGDLDQTLMNLITYTGLLSQYEERSH